MGEGTSLEGAMAGAEATQLRAKLIHSLALPSLSLASAGCWEHRFLGGQSPCHFKCKGGVQNKDHWCPCMTEAHLGKPLQALLFQTCPLKLRPLGGPALSSRPLETCPVKLRPLGQMVVLELVFVCLFYQTHHLHEDCSLIRSAHRSQGCWVAEGRSGHCSESSCATSSFASPGQDREHL